ncbi:MAG: endolytic transglycosylase MltG [bacterium]
MNDYRGHQTPSDRRDQPRHGGVDPWYAEPARKGGSWGPGGRPPRRWATRILIVGAFFVGIALVAAVANMGVNWVQGRSTTSTTKAAQGPSVSVVINPGMTATQVGMLLQEQGVIESAAAFVDLVKSRGTEGTLRPGIYQFTLGQELLQVVDKLEQGQGSASFKLTIPEGLAADQVATLLTEEGTINGASYVELSGQPTKFVAPKVGGAVPKVGTLEGLLFPSTYYLLKGDGATELIGAQLAAFEAKTASLPWDKATALGLTPYEIVIVASLIEKEASIADERAQVAAVIYNRLKEDMSLGIDATVRYAVDKWTGALTTEDLQVDSPYNTRVVKGLPPTPIANPGLATLRAALEPADVDYLYYVLSDTDGHHFFTASYDEFLQAKKNAPAQ